MFTKLRDALRKWLGVAGVNYSEGTPPSTINNSARLMMKEIAELRGGDNSP